MIECCECCVCVFGFGGFCVVNIFVLCEIDFYKMWKYIFLEGFENVVFIVEICDWVDIVIVVWGVYGDYLD